MNNSNLEILYEDEDIVAINKPAGIVVHNDGKNSFETLTDILLKKYPNIKNVGEPTRLSDGKIIERPGIVHRLDKETSGVMLIAKTQVGFTHLKSQFKKREISKIYHAFVYGNLKIDKQIIDWPIGRSKGDIMRWTIKRFARGKIREAVTEIKVLKRSTCHAQHQTVLGHVDLPRPASDGAGPRRPATSGKEYFSLIEARPMTGRTHQIRVHMKAIYHPIICDNLYAPGRSKMLGFERLALHSREIIFKNMKGKTVDVVGPYPEDFQKAIDLL